MSFLSVEDKKFLVFGVANRKSVAFHVARGLEREGANVIYVVRSEARREQIQKWVPPHSEIYVCDVEEKLNITNLAIEIRKHHPVVHGILHSIAFADFSDGLQPFHETDSKKFLQTVNVSCYSLIAIANAFKNELDPRGSVVTVSISTTEMACENYGWMAPAKAALESSVCFLAKSFSKFSSARFNSVCPGLLKTSASAGIPGYIDNYLYAEKCTLRKSAISTEEAANAAVFLLSPASSGINASKITVDAGMRVNYFDRSLIDRLD